MGTPPAVDSHAHVFDTARFPLTNPHGYVPQPNERGTPHEFRSVLAAHGMSHGLLVNPFTGYATNNACMLDAIAQADGHFKGVALVGHETGDAELEALAAGGVVGARFNTLFSGSTSLQGEPARGCSRASGSGMVCADLFPRRRGAEAAAHPGQGRHSRGGGPLRVSDPARGLGQPGFAAVLELWPARQRGRQAVGPFRYSRQPWPYTDCEPYVEALIAAFTLDNCVWGSDWPFVRLPMRVDYGPTRTLLERWIPDPGDRQRVLWETPRRWFGFTAPAHGSNG